MRKKIEKSDTRLPNTFRQTEPGIRAYTVDDMLETGYRIIKTSFDKWLDNE